VPLLPVFEEVAKGYLETYAPSRLKPSTKHGYENVIRRILVPRIGSLRLDAIDGAVVRKIDAQLATDGAQASTRRNVQAILRSVICRYAVEMGILEKATTFPSLPKVGRKIIDALTQEELEKILATSSPQHRRAFMLAAYAGLRAGEVRGLRWRDVDLTAGRLVVRRSICRGVEATPKSGHERIVPLAVVLRVELEKTEKRERDQPVSLNRQGEPWSEFTLALAFQRATKRAGLEGWRFHDLRHYFVTALFKSGAPAPTVQALAGHADLATTQRYAHVATLDLEAAIRRLR
jgi:integrase